MRLAPIRQLGRAGGATPHFSRSAFVLVGAEMSEPRFHVRLSGFRDGTTDPAGALAHTFGIPMERAKTLLERLPAYVKRDATAAEARRYADALARIGGQVSVLDAATGQPADLPSVGPSSQLAEVRKRATGTFRALPATGVTGSAPAVRPALPDSAGASVSVTAGASSGAGGTGSGGFAGRRPATLVGAGPRPATGATAAVAEPDRAAPPGGALLRPPTAKHPRPPLHASGAIPAVSVTSGFGGPAARPATAQHPRPVFPPAEDLPELSPLPAEAFPPVRPPTARHARPPLPASDGTGAFPGDGFGATRPAPIPARPPARLPASVTRTGSFVFQPPVDAPIPAPPSVPVPPPLGPLAASPGGSRAYTVARAPGGDGAPAPPTDDWPAGARPRPGVSPSDVEQLLAPHASSALSPSGLELDDARLRRREDAAHPAPPPILQQIPDFEPPGWAPLWSPSGSFQAAPGTASAGVPAAAKALPPGPTARAAATTRDPVRPGTAASRVDSAGRSNLIAGIIVAVVVVGAIVLIVQGAGGVSSELENGLRQAGQLYIPSLTMGEAEGGSLAASDRMQFTAEARAGRCYGWIAITHENAFCDLDLHISSAGRPLMQDILLDNVPVVFHCPEQDGPLQVTLANAGSDSCPYGLAHFEGLGSVGWPLEPYLTLYGDFLSAERGIRYMPVDDPHHAEPVPVATQHTYSVEIPPGSCRVVLAVAQQGNDLDMSLAVNGVVVQQDEALDNFPIVGYCAPENEDVTAEVKVWMYTGYGPYVWQVLEGPPL